VGGNITASNLNITGSRQSVFSGNSTVELVRITQTGTGDAFVVEDSLNLDTSHFVIDANGNTAIGLLAPSEKLHVSGNVRIDGNLTATTISATTYQNLPVDIQVAASDETTALITGTTKVTFRMPHAMIVKSVRASLSTTQTSGNIFTVDINEDGTSILSTKITIDNTEKTSVTAATPPVISDNVLADDSEITIDIDQVGDGTAKGLKVTLKGIRV
jgi:hypothetical protein